MVNGHIMKLTDLCIGVSLIGLACTIFLPQPFQLVTILLSVSRLFLIFLSCNSNGFPQLYAYSLQTWEQPILIWR